MNILLIAGHGAGDPGACATINGKTYREADEVRKLLALLVSDLSARYQVDVGHYSIDRNAYEDNRRGRLPAETFGGYDYVLELHLNALRSEKADGHTKGVEIYVPTSETSVGVELQIAQRIASLGLTNRGVKRKNFDVILAAKRAGVSSALLETCFIDDPDDMTVWLNKLPEIARAISNGIAAGFGLEKRQRTPWEIWQQAAGLSDATIAWLKTYRWSNDLARKTAEAMDR